MRKLSVVLVSAVVASAIATTSTAASSPAIGQTAIAGAKFGLTATAYEKLFSGPHRIRHVREFTILTFPTHKLAVLFIRSSRALSVITWNGAYRTDHGVGACSTLAQLQKAYGTALVQNRYGSYDVGNLLFSTTDSTPSAKVLAVGLYNSKAPRANQDFGAQPYTSYTIGNLLPACS